MRATSRTALNQPWKGYYFILATTVVLGLLVVYPLCYGVYISLFDTNLISKWNFVGLKYYQRILTDSRFYKSLWITTVFTFFVVVGRVVLGTLLAVLLNVKKLPGRLIFRSILVLPWFFPDVVVSILWKWLFHPSYGMINTLLLRAGFIDAPVEWLSHPSSALAAVILVSIWKGVAFVIIMVLAGLQTIPDELYEAAKIDGAGATSRFFHITLAGLRHVLSITTLLVTMWCFKHFTIVWNMTHGGPVDATNVVSIDIYKTAFSYFRFGESAARAVIVFVIIILFTVSYKRSLGSE